MVVLEILQKIRVAWTNRIINSLAHGAGIREVFQAQVSRFYDNLYQAAETGNASWLDPVLDDWAASPTQSVLREGQKNITAVLNQMIVVTIDVAREGLNDADALNLIATLLPIFTYALEKAASYEMDRRVAYISKELIDVQHKLEKLDQSKSNFIAVAAHELKTPLTLIEGYTAMMRDNTSQLQGIEKVDDLFIGINNGILRLRAIIDDMIDVSLIDNQLLSLTFQPVWLNQIFALLKNVLIGSIITRKQTLTIKNFPGASELLFADPERLSQAFKNLLMNAIKYTPDGGKVEVDGQLLPGFVEVTIRDNGIGISQEDQDSIFTKFEQLGKASLHSSGKTKFKGGGPGLGLAITKGIIEAHGGMVWVESEGYDEVRCPGSTFHVLLPIRSQPPDPKYAKLFGLEDHMKTQPKE